MEVNVEFKLFNKGYNIEKINPIMRSISFRLGKNKNIILRLNFDPNRVDYLIRESGSYIFIEAVGTTFNSPLKFGKLCYWSDGEFLDYIFNDIIGISDIDIDFGIDTIDSIISLETLTIINPELNDNRIYFSKSVLDEYNVKLMNMR